jgi:hypothetical protein
MEVMMKPRTADTRKVFRVDDKDVKSLFGVTDEKEKFLSFRQIEPKLDEMRKQVEQAAGTDEGKRTLFQRDVLKLHKALVLYRGLQNSLQPQGVQGFPDELALFQTSIVPGLAAVHSRASGEKHDERDLGLIVQFTDRYQMLSQVAGLNVIPPSDPTKPTEQFENVGQSLLGSIVSREVHPSLLRFARMSEAYQKSDAAAFNRELAEHRSFLAQNFPQGMKKASSEQLFNRIAPFYQCMVLYVAVFILACASWLTAPRSFGKAAYWLLLLTFVVHTAGLIFRMVLEGRPPVTNLYSSAIFIGWGSVALGIILERIYRNGIGSVVSGAVGLRHLDHRASPRDGRGHHGDDACSARFELLARDARGDHHAWLFRDLLGRLSCDHLCPARAIHQKPGRGHGQGSGAQRLWDYLLCAALQLRRYGARRHLGGSIVGPLLGLGSEGKRCAADRALECPDPSRALGRDDRQRGLMALRDLRKYHHEHELVRREHAGVGLHSYGFIDAAFFWLAGFTASQLLLIALAMVPLSRWRSFRGTQAPTNPTRPAAHSRCRPRAHLHGSALARTLGHEDGNRRAHHG